MRGVIRNLNPGRRGGTVWFDLVEPAAERRPGAAAARHAVGGAVRHRPPAGQRPADRRRRRVRMADGTEVRIRGAGSPGTTGAAGCSSRCPTSTRPSRSGASPPTATASSARSTARGCSPGRPRCPARSCRCGWAWSPARGSAAEHDVLDELRRSGIGFSVIAGRRAGAGRPTRPGRWPGGCGAVAARGVDAVLLVRGGGATTDLAAFDGEAIARAVAGLDVPVLTGIGHEIDRSVADEVAHAAYKTPTACAQAVVADVRAVERRTDDAWRGIARRRRGAARARGRAPAHVRAPCRPRHPPGPGGGRPRPRRAGRGCDGRRPAPRPLGPARGALDRAGRRAGGRAHLRTHERRWRAAVVRLAQRPPRLVAAAGTTSTARRSGAGARSARTLARGWSITRNADGRVLRSARRRGRATSWSPRWPTARCAVP